MCLVAWPLNKSAAVVDLAFLTDGVIMPISKFLAHDNDFPAF